MCAEALVVAAVVRQCRNSLLSASINQALTTCLLWCGLFVLSSPPATAGLSLAACSSSSTQHNGAQQQLTAQALQQQVLAAVTACGAAQAAALEQLQPAAAQLQEQEQAVRCVGCLEGGACC